MKINSYITGVFLLWSLSLQSAPDISMEVSRFSTDAGQFIEVSIYVIGTTLNCEAKSSADYGLEYTILIEDLQQNIVAANRYRLSRAGCPAQDIFDIKRFNLPAGQYTISLKAHDFNDTLSQLTISQQVEIINATGSAALSDLQLLANIKSDPDGVSPFHKSGVYCEPLPFNYYYPSLPQLSLYFETYHTEKLTGQPYLQYTIKPIAGDIPGAITTYKKVKKEPVVPNVFQLNISTLISGSYILEASLFDGNKELIASKEIAFARLNPYGDSLFLETAGTSLEFGFVNDIPEDSLDYTMRAMAPIVNSVDIEVMNLLLKKGNAKAKRFFIHRYWTIQSGKYAGVAFNTYMIVARAIDKIYMSGFGYGFETDRGHVFLKYGQPNEIVTVEDEPSAPPYEIWIYNDFPTTHQTNVRFLFYNPNLVKNGHELLHSTARGEVNNARWEVELYRDATLETPGVNEKVMGDNVHRNARTYFEY